MCLKDKATLESLLGMFTHPKPHKQLRFPILEQLERLIYLEIYDDGN